MAEFDATFWMRAAAVTQGVFAVILFFTALCADPEAMVIALNLLSALGSGLWVMYILDGGGTRDAAYLFIGLMTLSLLSVSPVLILRRRYRVARGIPISTPDSDDEDDEDGEGGGREERIRQQLARDMMASAGSSRRRGGRKRRSNNDSMQNDRGGGQSSEIADID